MVKKVTQKAQRELVKLAKAVASGDVRAQNALLAQLAPYVTKRPRKQKIRRCDTPVAERIEMCEILSHHGVSLQALCRQRNVSPSWFRRRCWDPYTRLGKQGVVPSFSARPSTRAYDDNKTIELVYKQWVATHANKKPGRRAKVLPVMSPSMTTTLVGAVIPEPRVVEFVCQYEEEE